MSSKEKKERFRTSAESFGKSLEAQVPILNYSRNLTTSNYIRFREALIEYAFDKYGDFARFITDEEYWQPPLVDIPEDEEFSAEKDPAGLFKFHIQNQISERNKEVNKLRSFCSMIYHFIWSRMSHTSRDVLARTNGWDEAKLRMDPLDLWKRIKKTHVSGTLGPSNLTIIPGEVKRQLYNCLLNVKMRDHDHLHRYLEEFQLALEAYKNSGVKPPEDDQIVAIFIENLNNKRYKEFKMRLLNDCRQNNIRYPNSYMEAYEKASMWESDNYDLVKPSAAPQLTTTTSYHVEANEDDTEEVGVSAFYTDYAIPAPTPDDTALANVRAVKTGPRRAQCKLCEDFGHVATSCPYIEIGRKAVKAKKKSSHVAIKVNDNNPFKISLLVSEDDMYIYHPNLTDILLDNGSQEHIFANKDLLINRSNTDLSISIQGQVSDAIFSTNKIGYLHGLSQKIYYSEKAKANLLSYGLLAQEYKIDWDQEEQCFTVYLTDELMIKFHQINSLYICDINKDIISIKKTYLSEIAINKSFFVPKEVAAAEEANSLIKKLGFPPSSSLVKLLQNGAINDAPCNSADVHRAEKIFGKNVPGLKGRSTRRKQKIARNIEFLENRLPQRQHGYSDVMFVNKQPFLITVVRPLDLVLTTKIKSTTASQLRKAFKSQISLLNAKGFQLDSIHADGGFACVQRFLGKEGIQLEISGSGAHVSIVEAKIKVIKNRIRSILSSLPYILPFSLMGYLVAFATQCINILISKNCPDLISPLEHFLGRKINYKVDLRIIFGEYVQSIDGQTDNSMTPRSSGSIALLSTHNLSGTVMFYDINTQKVVKRDRWVSLPISQEIIDRINIISSTQIASSTSLSVEMGANAVNVEDSIEEPTTNSPPPQVKMRESKEEEHIAIDLEAEDPFLESDESDDSDYSPSSHSDGSFEADFDEDNEGNEITIGPPTSPTRLSSPSTAHLPTVSPKYSRRTNRGRTKPLFGFHVALATAMQEFGFLGTEALEAEARQMEKKEVFVPILKTSLSLEQLRATIPSLVFLKKKLKPDGSIDKIKARIVAGGHRQNITLYPDNSSPTVNISNVFIEAAIAHKKQLIVTSLDIGSAYLNAKMKKKVVMKIGKEFTRILCKLFPKYEPYVDKNGCLYVILNKALYGCLESAQLWYEELKEKLLSLGFEINPYDPCVFFKSDELLIVTNSLSL